jgi:hypothetical protein
MYIVSFVFEIVATSCDQEHLKTYERDVLKGPDISRRSEYTVLYVKTYQLHLDGGPGQELFVVLILRIQSVKL